MRDKNTLLLAVSISISIFLIALAASLYSHLKKTELGFNEKKAILIKENLDLKDNIASLKGTLAQKKETLALLENEQESIEQRLGLFKEERESLRGEYEEELLALKK